MHKSSFRIVVALAVTLVLGALAGCSSATDASPTVTTVSSTVSYLSFSGTAGSDSTTNWGWSAADVAILPLTGKVIADAKVTYAFDTNYVANLTDAGADWKSYDATAASPFAWLFEFTTTTTPAAKTWITATYSTDATTAGYTTALTSGLGFGLWCKSNNAAASVYFKKIVLTYSDASTETITFTDTTGTNIHSVTSAGVATDPTFASRMVVSFTTNCVSPTQGIQTVSF